MEIRAIIEGINYTANLTKELKEIEIADFEINLAPSAFLLKLNSSTKFAISKWVTPKRTRTYPYERVYHTLNSNKRITVIPIIKDEGIKGDRDFLQWDTISLMSLLDVFIIFAKYDQATAVNGKFKNQKFDNDYILQKIHDIKNFHSSALHWNIQELNNNFIELLEKSKSFYQRLEEETGIKAHNSKGIDNFKEKIGKDLSTFMNFSRSKAQQAQSREMATIQAGESLKTLTKAKITINNYLGGEYYFTTDEVLIQNDSIFLIECKHTNYKNLPSRSDILDGVLKLILYTNLNKVGVENKFYKSKAILRLTSSMLKGRISSVDKNNEIEEFKSNNIFTKPQLLLIDKLFMESNVNNFITIIENPND